MKPIILKIKGINSFIEEQTIDFTSLTQLGLFGIFGPTGSGKSTILDGITLALYGEIPRARNLSTKKDLSGIINTQCQQGMVYYEFEMGSPDERKRYMVSRSFKKDGQGNVKTNRVLLCDITHREEPVVLEEKVTPLNHRMVEIIGLTRGFYPFCGAAPETLVIFSNSAGRIDGICWSDLCPPGV